MSNVLFERGCKGNHRPARCWELGGSGSGLSHHETLLKELLHGDLWASWQHPAEAHDWRTPSERLPSAFYTDHNLDVYYWFLNRQTNCKIWKKKMCTMSWYKHAMSYADVTGVVYIVQLNMSAALIQADLWDPHCVAQLPQFSCLWSLLWLLWQRLYCAAAMVG